LQQLRCEVNNGLGMGRQGPGFGGAAPAWGASGPSGVQGATHASLLAEEVDRLTNNAVEAELEHERMEVGAAGTGCCSCCLQVRQGGARMQWHLY
jgi:hypothetical protein